MISNPQERVLPGQIYYYELPNIENCREFVVRLYFIDFSYLYVNFHVSAIGETKFAILPQASLPFPFVILSYLAATKKLQVQVINDFTGCIRVESIYSK